MNQALPFPEFRALQGTEFYVSDWHKVTQDDICAFAQATDDHQWIHTDPEKARILSPWGRTVAHGYLTLSLIPSLLFPSFKSMGLTRVLNYGCNRVRFPEAVRSDDRVRGQFTLKEAKSGPYGGLMVEITANIEHENHDKPACVADVLFVLYT